MAPLCRRKGSATIGKAASRDSVPRQRYARACMEASGNGPLDEQERKNWIGWAEKNKISWITWSVTDKNETCSMLLPSAASEGNWQEKDMKESGIKTRSLIREYNGHN